MWRDRLRHLRRDESGMSLVYVGLGFMAFMGASMLSVDVGMSMTARSQAQNAADAGALAGGIALAFNDYNDRTSTGPAVTSAISAGTSNSVMGQPPSIIPSDVTFPNDPAGNPNRVRVQVFRTTERKNPIPTIVAAIFKMPTVSIGANATAEVSPANAETCVLPFTIPDKWEEKIDDKGVADGPWSPNTSEFNMYDKKGNLFANHDVYTPGVTSYDPKTDVGLELILKNNNTGKVAPSMYNPWDLPGSTGGDDYRDNIASCNTNIFQPGQNMPPENGNMVGPTKQGVDLLIAKDPGAKWDTSCKCVKNSAFGISPRIGVIPLYDPVAYAQGQQSGKNAVLTMVNYLGFFIDQVDAGGQVWGYITPIGGLVKGTGGPAASFPKVIRLVQ